MPGFGERLKHEREIRDTTIDDLAAASGIGRGYLEALERDEFDALPGRAFGKFYIRVYAEILGFDAQELIEAYDRERLGDPRTAAEPPRDHNRPRPVHAAIAQWREARIREREQPASGIPSSEVPADEAPETPAPTSVEVPPAPEQEPAATRANGRAEPADVAVAIPARPRRRTGPVLGLIGSVLLVGAAVAYLVHARRSAEESRPPASVVSEPARPGTDLAPVDPARVANPTASAERPSAPPSATADAAASASTGAARLSVAEFGIGRSIVEHRLEGRDERFTKGDVVWFSTRVVGGDSGGHIRHVWIHAGRVLHSIRLGLGGPDWRTQSRQTLGDVASWTAEARDEQGRVLARQTFTCEPP